MGFSRQESWSGLPCPSPGDLSDAEVKFSSLVAPAPQADSLPLSHHMPCGRKKKKREKVQGDCFLGNCYRLSLLTLPAFEKVYNLINFHERNIWEQHPDQNTRVFLALKPPCAPSQQWSTGFSQQRLVYFCPEVDSYNMYPL